MSRHPGPRLRRLLSGAALSLVVLSPAGCAAVVAGEVVRVVAVDRSSQRLLASYPVSDDGELGPAELVRLRDRGLAELRDDRAAHEDAWWLWRSIAPEPWLSTVLELRIVTDGTDGELAGVLPAGDGWILELDAADLALRPELEHTLVHELAHLISLGPDQLDMARRPAAGLVEAARSCAPAVGVEEGCLLPDAYLATFVERFWTAEDLRRADEVAAGNDPEGGSAAWYAAESDRFTSEYAVTHPAEDFAESWATYVLYEWELEDPAVVWVRKAAFFDDYPELRGVRDDIWRSLGIE